MPAATATVLYPQTSDSDFKLDYYLSSHMPMVMKHFGPHGMTGYNVTKLTGTPSGDKSEYSVQCILQFEQADQIPKALAAEGATVMGDIPNFSNKQPVIFLGEVVGTN
ncbi:hypothetical protein B0A49_07092 [Cryomyces minteri]|uniref:EthD domain-containing protein n=1 Tax=Cryomyces minteri TaxID=331657 RepID=A0A4V6WKR9_9PEZI|nr:hypothetical protein B0A49_13486 [Cryomyces minteri]TKA36463.1 hypothetical protein B0A49_13818 [Cryomyces minteri]TKA61969.1 hypothetical protein B0A49_09812 [Cryomyces minteri]TKA64308.1 hypothetical protein B0A49_07092 [Cryomyces minteri]